MLRRPSSLLASPEAIPRLMLEDVAAPAVQKELQFDSGVELALIEAGGYLARSATQTLLEPATTGSREFN